jgi:hypothetical protein
LVQSSSPKRDRNRGNAGASTPVFLPEDPHIGGGSQEEKTMTRFKLLGAVAIVSALIVSPASAQHMIEEPGMFAFVHPDGDLGIGSARPAVEAQAKIQAPRLIMRHPLTTRRATSSK